MSTEDEKHQNHHLKHQSDKQNSIESSSLLVSSSTTIPASSLNCCNEKNKIHHNLKNGEIKEMGNYNGDNDENNLNSDIKRVIDHMPLTDETTCGFWIFKGSFFQRFANKKAYVIIYGIVGCIFSMTYAYFNGTITTIEKRFKIPSRNTGIISVGNDISTLFVSAALSYYAGKGHRPRWIAFGILTIVLFCILTAVPHLLYGPGEDALSLSKEYGGLSHDNVTLYTQKTKSLCMNPLNGKRDSCESEEGSLEPQLILFFAQFISGIGGSLYYTLGVSYMDDNIKKSKTPALLSLSYFVRMLGPALGYALASFCLRYYISPSLTPIINNKDPRWLGAYWLGWLILAALLFISAVFLAMFPRALPRAVARKMLEKEKLKNKDEEPEPELPASFKDMMKTFKRLITNATLMCNNMASIFYFFGYMPYWIFTPKYIEIQYRQSAATSSLVTGTVALGFSAIGILISGFVISKYKPKARYMAAWNVIIGILSVFGILAYAFLGCPGNEQSVIVNIPETHPNPTCNAACQCDYVRYSPICGEDGNTYISPCHAGCRGQYVGIDGKRIYYDCNCIYTKAQNNTVEYFQRLISTQNGTDDSIHLYENQLNYSIKDIEKFDISLSSQAIPGACPVDCFKQFVLFLSVMCFLKFIGATGRASNFLVSVRCVPEKDKTVAMGFGLTMMSLFAFIPSPIFFGWVLDSLCLVWGKTCTNKGNCWLYDAEALRYNLNVIAAIFVALGCIFDMGVWYYVKDLKIFDEEVKEQELEEFKKDERRGSLCVKDVGNLN